jgi:hypothetical protein
VSPKSEDRDIRTVYITQSYESLLVQKFLSVHRRQNIKKVSYFVTPRRSTLVAVGGLVVSVLATGPKVRGFDPDRGRWIFKGRGSKAVGPMS